LDLLVLQRRHVLAVAFLGYGGQLWRQDAMDALLAQHATGWLRRSVRLSSRLVYDRFDAVVLLSVPREVILQRIASRSTNPLRQACSRAATHLGRSEGCGAASAGNLDGRDYDNDPRNRGC
jgi:hypothetical protein